MKKSLIIMDLAYLDQVYPQEYRKEIERRTDLIHPPMSKEELVKNPEILEGVQCIFSGWGGPHFDASLLKHAKDLEIIFYGAGSIRKIVSKEFWEDGKRITSAQKANAIPVAEYTMACIIFSLKDALAMNTYLKEHHDYPKSLRNNIKGSFKARVGLVSFGAIAKRLLKLLEPLDLHIQVYDPYLSTEEAEIYNVRKVTLSELFETSDVISVHTPLLEETEGMIDAGLLSKMKDDAAIINTARGKVFKQEDLVDHLINHPTCTAYLDVVYPEPLTKSHELYKLDNVFLTPHIAGSEGREISRMGSYMVEEMKRYLAQKPLMYEVSKEDSERMA